jgi:Nucleoside transporter
LSDRWVHLIFLLLGIGVLVPWNAFISAVPYFQGRICSLPKASAQFESWVGLLFNLSSVASLSLLLSWPWVQRRCRQSRRILGTEERPEEIQIEELEVVEQPQPQQNSNNHSFWFVIFPLILFLLVFVVSDILVALKDLSAQFFLFLTLLGMMISGAGSAFATAGIVATSSSFPARLGIHPFVSGQAIGGVAVSVANFLSAAAEDPQLYWDQHCTPRNTTTTATSTATFLLEEENSVGECLPYETFDTAVFLYFLVGVIVLMSCIVGYAILTRQSQAQEQYETVDSHREVSATEDEFRDEPSPRNALELPPTPNNLEADADDFLQRLPSDTSHPSVDSSASDSSTAILNAIQGPAFCIFFTFLVTLSLFPSWTTRLHSIRQCHSYGHRMSNDLFIPFTFVLFNLGDLGGRILAGMVDIAKISNFSTKLVLAAMFRCLFFPLLLLCVGGTDPDRLQIHSDIYSLVVQGLFALTNGFLISLGFMHAPTLIPGNQEAQEKSSEILTFSLSCGLLCGSLLSFPVAELTS